MRVSVERSAPALPAFERRGARSAGSSRRAALPRVGNSDLVAPVYGFEVRHLRLACAVRVLTPATSDDGTVDVVAGTDAVNTYGYVVEQSSCQLDRSPASPAAFYDRALDAPEATIHRALPETPLGADVPHRERLAAAGYTPVDDLAGPNVEDFVVCARLMATEARQVLAV